MELMTDSLLSEQHKDGLKEIGNIGAGHVSEYLSDYTGGQIDMDVPKIEVLDVKSSVKSFNDLVNEEDNSISIYSPIKNLKGSVIFNSSESGVRDLLDTDDMDKVDQEIQEKMEDVVGSITGAYLDAIDDFLGLKMENSEPELVFKYPSTLLYSFINEIFVEDIQTLENSRVLITVNNFELSNGAEFRLLFIIALEDIDQLTNALDKMI